MRALSRRAALALAASAFAPRLTRARDGGFGAFLESLWPRAREQGVTRATFDAELMNLSPDPGLMGAGARQAEFERTIKAYIDDAVSAGRVARGQAARARWANALARIERKEGVPAEIILAVWGMETDFGKASAGEKDVIRSLATLAFARGRDDLFDEVIAALVMIQRGLATRARLRGSWAGAMGQPQFLPSAYLKYAVSFGDAGAPDIWTSTEDSLASIAHFLRAQGWAPGQIWGAETKVPTGDDWRTTGSSSSTTTRIPTRCRSRCSANASPGAPRSARHGPRISNRWPRRIASGCRNCCAIADSTTARSTGALALRRATPFIAIS